MKRMNELQAYRLSFTVTLLACVGICLLMACFQHDYGSLVFAARCLDDLKPLMNRAFQTPDKAKE